MPGREDELFQGLRDRIIAGDTAAEDEAISHLVRRIPALCRAFVKLQPHAKYLYLDDELASVAQAAIVRAVRKIKARQPRDLTAYIHKSVRHALRKALVESGAFGPKRATVDARRKRGVPTGQRSKRPEFAIEAELCRPGKNSRPVKRCPVPKFVQRVDAMDDVASLGETDRDKEFVRLAIAGHSDEEIAKRLNVTTRTVRSIRQRVGVSYNFELFDCGRELTDEETAARWQVSLSQARAMPRWTPERAAKEEAEIAIARSPLSRHNDRNRQNALRFDASHSGLRPALPDRGAFVWRELPPSPPIDYSRNCMDPRAR